MLAEWQGCDGLLLAATPDGLLCPTHLAELDLHEDVVLSPTAPLCTPGVLGSVGAGAAGRGPPVAREANSCPGKRERGQGDPFPSVPPLREGLSPGAGDPLLGGRRGKEGGRTKASEVRSGSWLPAAQGQGWTPAQALPPGGWAPCHSSHLHVLLLTCGRGGGQSLGPHRGARQGRPHAAPLGCWAPGSGQVPAAGPCCPAAVRSAHPAR